jgi:F-type H+-transporting ATPase subunit delta
MNVNDIAIRLAEVYSQALFALARESDCVESVKEDVDAIIAIIDQDADFISLMVSPYFSEQYKQALVLKVFSGRLNELTMNFLKIVIEHERTVFLPQILDRFNEHWDALHGRAVVKVTVSEPIDEKELAKLTIDISVTMNRPADVVMNVNPEIIGGAVINYGDSIIDNSIRGRLARAVTAVTGRAKRGLEINEV